MGLGSEEIEPLSEQYLHPHRVEQDHNYDGGIPIESCESWRVPLHGLLRAVAGFGAFAALIWGQYQCSKLIERKPRFAENPPIMDIYSSDTINSSREYVLKEGKPSPLDSIAERRVTDFESK